MQYLIKIHLLLTCLLTAATVVSQTITQTIKDSSSIAEKEKKKIAYYTVSTGCEIWIKKNLILYEKNNDEISDYTSFERGFLSGRGIYPLISFSYENKQPLRHTFGFNFMKKKNITSFDYGVNFSTIDNIQSYSIFYQFDYLVGKKEKLPFKFYVGSKLLLNYLNYSTIDYPSPAEILPNTTTFQNSYTIQFQLISGIRLKKRVDISIGLNFNIATYIWGNYHYSNTTYSGRYEQVIDMDKVALAWNLYKANLMFNTLNFSIGYRFPVKHKSSKQAILK